MLTDYILLIIFIACLWLMPGKANPQFKNFLLAITGTSYNNH